MLIGLNGQNLLIKHPAGPEKFTINLYKSLAKIDKTNKYVVYLNTNPDIDKFKLITNNNPNFNYKVLEKGLSWTQQSLSLELIKYPVDIFFTAIHTLPILNTLPLIKSKKTKFVSMIHGLEFKYLPKMKLLGKILYGRHEQYVSLFTDKLIVPTETIKYQITNKWKINPEKITVITEGLNEGFYKRTTSEISNVTSKYNISDPYIIFISTIQPRKNLPLTIAAVSQIIKNNNEYNNLQLVICGKKGWSYDESILAPDKYGIKNNVRFLGWTPDQDLPILLSGAKALVNFSYDEGFGLPLIEAMACEIPCAVSDIRVYKEIGKDYVSYADPNNINLIEKAILTSLSIKESNPKLLEKAAEYAKSFSWDKTATETLNLFKNA